MNDTTCLELGIMRYGWFSVLARHCDLPDTETVFRHGCCVTIPTIEVTDKVCAQRIRCPLAIYDVAVALNMKAEFVKALSTNR